MSRYGEEYRLATRMKWNFNSNWFTNYTKLSKHCSSLMKIKVYDFGFRVGRTTNWHGIQQNTAASKCCMFHPIRFGFRTLVSGDFPIFCIFLSNSTRKANWKTGSHKSSSLQTVRKAWDKNSLSYFILYHMLYRTVWRYEGLRFSTNHTRPFLNDLERNVWQRILREMTTNRIYSVLYNK